MDGISDMAAARNKTVSAASGGDEHDAGALIEAKIAHLSDWRGETLARLRRLIRAADPGITEEIKWIKPTNPSGVPV